MKSTLKISLMLIGLLFLGSCSPWINTPTLTQISPVATDDITPSPNPELTSPAAQTESPAPSTPLNRNPEAYAGLPILHGINLGNALEAPWPGYWGVTITADLIQSIAEAGFNAIRVPVRFSVHTGATPEYALSETLFQTVDEVVQWGLDAGLTVILDLHHFDTLMQSPEQEEDRYLAIWTQLAVRYQDLPDTLYFELLNEPSGALDADTWNNLVEKSVHIIRRTNPTRTVIIGSVDYSSIDALEQLVLPDDSHLVTTFHYYDPFEFTHQGAAWVDGSSSWLGTTWVSTSEKLLNVQQAFDRAVDWSNANQIPLILGEFGVIENADDPSRQAWIETVRQAAEARGIGWFYWDLCSEFGVYDCDREIWNQTIIEILLP